MSSDPVAPRTSHRGLRAILVALALIALVVVVIGVATRTTAANHLRERVQAQSVPTVVVIAPGKAGVRATLDLPARTDAFSRAPIYARVSGYLKRWYADIGTPVKAGQLLAEIDAPDLDQQLLQARAELANAKASAALAASTAKRWESLLATNYVSRQQVDEKDADLAAKQASVSAAQANVERYQAMKGFTRIVAPFDGVVTSRTTDVGALINVGSAQGAELFVVSDTKKLRIYVNVPQSYVAVVRRGTTAKVTAPESPGKSHTATVQSLSQAINSASGSMLVQLIADNANAELLPGGFATVSFQLPTSASAVTIPPSALIFDKAGLRVATVDGQGKVALKPVTVARDLGAVIELASGLSADDHVIESPPDGLADGDPVRIAAPGGDAGTTGAAGKRGRGEK